MTGFLSVFVIIVGLCALMYLAYKGHSVLWAAPISATVIVLLSALIPDTKAAPLDTFLKVYMPGLAGYVSSWFPAFCLGAIYGKVMELTGSARSLGQKLVQVIGPKFAVLAVVLPCLLMTYGGISLFVVVFVIYPMGYAIFRSANLPRTLLPGCIAFGAFTITMTATPGTPQIQNLIPMQFYGTTPMAAPVMSILATVVVGLIDYFYLDAQARKARKLGKTFIEDPNFIEAKVDYELPSWHWVAGLLPLIMVVIVLNVFKQNIVPSLLSGIALCCLLNWKQWKTLLPAISEGAKGSLIAIMNTSSEVAFGAVVRSMAGFAILSTAVLNMPGGILLAEAVSVNALAGICGSASGGLSAALTALGPQFLERAQAIGMDPGLLHRIASLASGGLDTLPHNGAVITLLAVSHCTHKESYKDIGVVCTLVPVAASVVFAIVWGLFV
jgi:H+/gluconate symporter-like permease